MNYFDLYIGLTICPNNTFSKSISGAHVSFLKTVD